MIDYKGKNIVIIGLGITGLSCVNYFISKGVIPKVIDTRLNPLGLDKLDARITCHLGGLNLEWMIHADLIITSPGIALFSTELMKAKEKGIEIIGDIELFCREFNQLKNKKLVAITGSNGKTTVTTLVGEVIRNLGIKVGVGGNIGQPALSLLQDEYDVFVLELSSFQLETVHSLKANVATILNITEDHMDRYPEGLMQYVEAKQRIYKNAQSCVINANDKLTYPDLLSDQENFITFARSEFVNTKTKKIRAKYYLDAECKHLMMEDQIILNSNELQLFGIHNYLNILATLAICDQIDIDYRSSLKTIKSFKGLPHRFELIFEKDQVKWINDSKATNVGSTEAALQSFVCHGCLYLLLGGDGKNADFSSLIPHLSNKKDYVVYCFGRDKDILASLIPERSIKTETLKQAMTDIIKKVKKDDVVLLSPACASLDQFKNYEERGKMFTALAKELNR